MARLGTPWISASPAMRDWFGLLAAHRTPADSIYYPNANYQVQGSSTWCAATRCRRSQAQYRLLDALGVQRFNIVDLACGMENMSDPHTLPAMLDAVNVSIAEAGGPDWLRGRGYVYGFDELAVDKLPVLIQIYGAVKARFGDSVKTVATLPDYPKPGMPVQNMQSLPVDVWVDAFLGHSRGAPYDAAKRATVAAFKASGKECEARGAAPASFCLSVCARTHSFPALYRSIVDFWYWGIDPKNSTYMNTFIERPAIQARLMYWLMALHDVRGMLYCE